MKIAADILETVGAIVGPANGVVPLHEPEFRGNERAYVLDCVDTGWVSSVGAYVDRIERDLAEVAGVGHAVATSNGTSALHICFVVAGVERGDEVLMPSLTFIATANAAVYAGGIPHFVDVETTSLGIDPVKLEQHLEAVARIEDGRCVNRLTGATIRAHLRDARVWPPVSVG
ncbi:DegT/DnrJ/EryC1/StrS family aminotransferase [Sphingomonas lacunae]|uniref:DegT/DnrJ/EryC1/StrS family aminotransferase n=1 Tax=Sphingomonas lacunae TaxID=2698828 RepID=UPI00248463C7|nr:DegT/DnrJ/EryC1/StrS family aminotransferase [Sphingomonas lacunae]